MWILAAHSRHLHIISVSFSTSLLRYHAHICPHLKNFLPVWSRYQLIPTSVRRLTDDGAVYTAWPTTSTAGRGGTHVQVRLTYPCNWIHRAVAGVSVADALTAHRDVLDRIEILQRTTIRTRSTTRPHQQSNVRVSSLRRTLGDWEWCLCVENSKYVSSKER